MTSTLDQSPIEQQLNAESLMKVAQEQTGLTDFGDHHFVEPLKKLLSCSIKDVGFHSQGVEIFKTDITRCLVNRLRAVDDFKKHPEIFDEDVSDPIIILGLGRSGTTKLQKMLSAPDNVQKLTFWRMLNPAPFPEYHPRNNTQDIPDPRIEAANFSGLVTADNQDDLNAAHLMNHLEIEEDGMLFFHTFEDWVWSNVLPNFNYYDWVMERDNTHAYQYVKQLLQYMQWQRGGKKGHPWVLKSIAHTANMDTLMSCFPNATLVHAHRDPRQTIPSWAKFQRDLWCIMAKPQSPKVAGEIAIKYYKNSIDRYLEARQRLQLDDRIIDVSYEDIRSNAMGVMHTIFERSGRTLTDQAKATMAEWDSNNEQGKHGKHTYSLQEFGLSNEIIDEAFGNYIQRFIKRSVT